MTTVSENLIAHVRSELEKLEYGSVTITVVNGNTADVTTETRRRFPELPLTRERRNG